MTLYLTFVIKLKIEFTILCIVGTQQSHKYTILIKHANNLTTICC